MTRWTPVRLPARLWLRLEGFLVFRRVAVQQQRQQQLEV
jgi:hypothetical protein